MQCPFFYKVHLQRHSFPALLLARQPSARMRSEGCEFYFITYFDYSRHKLTYSAVHELAVEKCFVAELERFPVMIRLHWVGHFLLREELLTAIL